MPLSVMKAEELLDEKLGRGVRYAKGGEALEVSFVVRQASQG